jgi:hypothetical protein
MSIISEFFFFLVHFPFPFPCLFLAAIRVKLSKEYAPESCHVVIQLLVIGDPLRSDLYHADLHARYIIYLVSDQSHTLYLIYYTYRPKSNSHNTRVVSNLGLYKKKT